MGKILFTAAVSGGLFLVGFSAYRAWVPGASVAEARPDSVLSLFKREAVPHGLMPGPRSLEGGIHRVISSDSAQRHKVELDRGPPSLGYSSALPLDQARVEAEIDSVPLAPFEQTIAAAFGDSSEGRLLRRITIARRYAANLPGSDRLEDVYLEELSKEPDVTVRVIADTLRALPKGEFRDEHVLLRDLVNRIPDGYSRLHDLLPDEEFR